MYKRQLAGRGIDLEAAGPYELGYAPRGAAFQQAMTPVSYTHLRAHETELDLVCRLLLETK